MPLTDEDLSETLALDVVPARQLAARRRNAQEQMDWCYQNFSATPDEENLRQLNLATLIYRHLVGVVLPSEGLHSDGSVS